jgi:hypothetical protein
MCQGEVDHFAQVILPISLFKCNLPRLDDFALYLGTYWLILPYIWVLIVDFLGIYWFVPAQMSSFLFLCVNMRTVH